LKYLLVAIFIHSVANVQSQGSIRDNILNEVDNLIYNGYELLGKTEYEILNQGRPSFLKGGSSWKTSITIPAANEYTNKVIYIETGTGSSISLYISKRTNLVYSINLNPLLWVSFDEMNQHLKTNYTINKDGRSNSIKSNNSEYITFRLTMAEDSTYISITAVDIEKKVVKFY